MNSDQSDFLMTLIIDKILIIYGTISALNFRKQLSRSNQGFGRILEINSKQAASAESYFVATCCSNF